MRLVFSLLCVLLAAGSALAQQNQIRLEQVVGGLTAPVQITHSFDGSGRLFVAEQSGRIRIVRNGQLVTTPFLDIASRVIFDGEQGLLGLAFPADYQQSGVFYVNYVAPNPRRTVVSRFRVSNNPDVANPASEEILLTFEQPFANHNGGHLEFSPRDGFLYIASGDGGSGGDPLNAGQDLRTLLGKILRIDVNARTGSIPYAVPGSNPFVGTANAKTEIWAYGLRNPWKFAFDRDGSMWMGDVGQNAREEINFQPASSRGGENYGWRVKEGDLCFEQPNCNSAGLVDPVITYPRSQGVSVTGGRVYRGSQYPASRGTYVYGDFGTRRIWSARNLDGSIQSVWQLTAPMPVSTFGEDQLGEMYVAGYSNTDRGALYRMIFELSPQVPAGGVVNGASFRGRLTAGSIASIFGVGISREEGIRFAERTTPIDDSINGIAVLVNGRRAPIFAIASVNGVEQINFQVPWDATGDAVDVVVDNNGIRSTALRVQQALNPAIFRKEDGSVAAIFSDVSGAPLGGNEAVSNGFVSLYVTGLGPVASNQTTGVVAPSTPVSTQNLAEVFVGGQRATVTFSGLAPGFAGLYQVNFRVPTGIRGDTDVVVAINGERSEGVRMRVR